MGVREREVRGFSSDKRATHKYDIMYSKRSLNVHTKLGLPEELTLCLYRALFQHCWLFTLCFRQVNLLQSDSHVDLPAQRISVENSGIQPNALAYRMP